MKRGGLLLSVLAVLVLLVAADKTDRYRLVETWRDPAFDGEPFKKLVIIGISDDREARRQFENKFVSHLRGRGFEGVTSYSIVPDLTTVEDEDEIVHNIRRQEIDAAITVRVIALRDEGEKAWSAAWKEVVGQEADLPGFVDDSLPIQARKAKKYGVEVALWETKYWEKIWAGRTDALTQKQLRKGPAQFVQFVMDGMTFDGLL